MVMFRYTSGVPPVYLRYISGKPPVYLSCFAAPARRLLWLPSNAWTRLLRWYLRLRPAEIHVSPDAVRDRSGSMSAAIVVAPCAQGWSGLTSLDRKSTRLNSSHL